MASNAEEFSAYLVTSGLAAVEAEVYKTIEVLIADGTPTQAAALKNAYEHLLSDLRKLSVEVAERAKKYIVAEELKSRVRPAPTGDTVLLEDYLGESAALPGVEGSVGINREEPLEQHVPWWWTNEEGYSGHVGREVTGFFFDSGYSNPSAPDPSRSREHPLFMAGSAQRAVFSSVGFSGGAGARGGSGRRMTIRNPIPARHFVEEGYRLAAADWHKQHAIARQRFDRKVTQIFGQRP